MNDFKDLTNFANKIYGTDMSPDEYAKEWESQQYYDSSASWGDITRGVELIDTVGSFDAAAIAAYNAQYGTSYTAEEAAAALGD